MGNVSYKSFLVLHLSLNTRRRINTERKQKKIPCCMFTIHHIPYTIHYTLHPTSYIMQHTSYAIHSSPYTTHADSP
ncbi:hypothetical protein EON63_03460 [archaeon]|nr:MAG: hypothetical protein EON63_03460 [archaeon]